MKESISSSTVGGAAKTVTSGGGTKNGIFEELHKGSKTTTSGYADQTMSVTVTVNLIKSVRSEYCVSHNGRLQKEGYR